MRFRVLNSYPEFDYREACKITQGIDMVKDKSIKRIKGDLTEWWIKQICANHSTLRSVHFRLVDTRPKSVIMQIIRATKGHPQPEVQSSRPDWTGKERSYDPYEDKLFMQDHTAESFTAMASQRLCMKTEEKTRQFMYEMVVTLRKSKNPFLKAVGYCCSPQCVRNGGKCTELKPCRDNVERLSDDIIAIYRKSEKE